MNSNDLPMGSIIGLQPDERERVEEATADLVNWRPHRANDTEYLVNVTRRDHDIHIVVGGDLSIIPDELGYLERIGWVISAIDANLPQ